MSNDVTTLEVEIAGTTISFETGRMAKQASGAVVVRAGDTMILSTATMGNLRDADFLPLTVDVEERMYAAGKIPGSFFKREGRSGEKATLTARMIDRPLRPLFPKGWRYETQLVTIPLSVDHDHPFDILAMNGASAALMISPIPLPTPVGAVRIGKVEGNFVVNPTEEQLLDGTELDLIVAGTDEAILMVEAGAEEISEAEILDALDIAHGEIKKICALQWELKEKVGRPEVHPDVEGVDPALTDEIRSSHGSDLDAATQVEDKLARQEATKAVEASVLVKYSGDPDADTFELYKGRAKAAFAALEKSVIRQRIAVDKKRPDGRSDKQIRQITIEASVTPRTHGSALFTRGQTQALSVATLGTLKEEMRLDTLGLETKKHYWHHYNFPPFSVGEAGFMRGPKRRDIGHGALAERALVPVVPSIKDFPYTIRVVSDIPRVQRLELDGLRLRLLAVAHGRGRAAQGARRGHRHGAHQGGRRLHRPHRHRRRRGPPRRHGLQGRRHRGGHHRPPDGHQDHGRHLRHPARRGSRRPATPAWTSSARWPPCSRSRASSSRRTRRASRRSRSTRTRSAWSSARAGRPSGGLQDEFESQIDINDDGTILVYSANGDLADRLVERLTTMTKEVAVGDSYKGKVVKTTTFGAFVELAKGTDGPAAHLQRQARRARRRGGERPQQGRRDRRARRRGGPRARPHRPAHGRRPPTSPASRSRSSRPSAAAAGVAATVARAVSARAAAATATAAAVAVSATAAARAARVARATPSATSRPSEPIRAMSDGAAGLTGHRFTELDSGVRVVTEEMSSVRSVALGLWVGTGSAHEAEPEAGLSHLVEHMLFRGTAGYGSLEIDQLFDTMGAELNAGTGQESTSVHARVLDEHLERAFDVMADMVWRPKLAEEDLDNEREIVLEELAMYEDEPQDKVLDVLGETVFGTHALGRSPLGRPEVLHDIRSAGLRDFWAGRYGPANVVVSAAGSIDHDHLVALVAAAQDGAQTAPGGGRGTAHEPWSGYERRVAFVDRTTEQTHVCLGGPGLARDDERRWALRLLDTILGGTSSSRLFQAVREERGLAYSVSSFQALFAGAGEVGLYLGTRADNVPQALEVVGDELRRLAHDGITDDELSRARDHTAGAIVLGLESTSARMHRLGSTTLAGMPLLGVDELLERIGAVTAEDVRTLAAELYAPERLCVVGIGADRKGFETGVERLAHAA